MHPELLDLLAQHPDRAVFQIFTNGQFITEKIAKRLRQIGNATPLISIEVPEIVSDERRGKKEVFARTLRGLGCVPERAHPHRRGHERLPKTNIGELCTESWLRELIARGVHYVWFHTYRPVGPKMNPALALRPEQLVEVRRFVVEMRAKVPIAIIDAYYDGKGQALCPMSTGISHHVNPRGDIEPCPIIQFATENIDDSRGIFTTMKNSHFLKDFRKELSAQHKARRMRKFWKRPDLGQGTRGETRRAGYDHARHGHGGTRCDDSPLQPMAAGRGDPRKTLDVSLGQKILVQRLRRL